MQQIMGLGFFIVAFWVYKEYNALLLSGFFVGLGLVYLDLFKWIIRNFILTVIIAIIVCIMAILSFPDDANITTCSGILLVGCVLLVLMNKVTKK